MERKNAQRAWGQAQKGEDPPGVCLKPSSSYFEWRQVRPQADRDDSGRMATFYDKSSNNREFCHLEECEFEVDAA